VMVNGRELSQQCLWALNWPNVVYAAYSSIVVNFPHMPCFQSSRYAAGGFRFHRISVLGLGSIHPGTLE
jgi:hypothetical protein